MISPNPLVSTSVMASMFLCLASAVEAAPLFESHDILEVRIEAPFRTLAKVRSDEEYLDGALSYTGADGKQYSFDLKVRARGRYRRQKTTCDFPPVRLNFRTQQLEGSEFEGQDKLKLVSYCKKRTRFEQLVLREYLAYRILQVLTDRSFGVRLLHITYVDTDRDGELLTKYGFIIEDEDDVGERIGLTSLETTGLDYDDLDARHANLISMYQYLIGNTDFSLIRGPADDDCCHNSVPFSDGQLVTPVPYDFDFSGLVNAPYAEPNPRFKIRSVRTRVYRGRCSNNSVLPNTIEHIAGRKAVIYALLDDTPDLDKKNRAEVTRYLDSFFAEVGDPDQVERNFIKECS